MIAVHDHFLREYDCVRTVMVEARCEAMDRWVIGILCL